MNLLSPYIHISILKAKTTLTARHFQKPLEASSMDSVTPVCLLKHDYLCYAIFYLAME